MQRLTAPPRDLMTNDEVAQVLTADVLEVAAGVELLDDQDQVVGILSDEVVGGTVRRDNLADVHGTVDLVLAKELAWGRDRVRPFVTLVADGVLQARFYLGVYLLTTPVRALDTDPLWTVSGYDKLHLLQGVLPETLTIAAGTAYLDAVRSVIAQAGGGTRVLLDSAAAGKVLPAPMTWPLRESAPSTETDPTVQAGSTYLAVVNALLAAVGYRGVWADQDGFFRSEPYQVAAQRPAEWDLDVDDELRTIVSEGRKVTADVWGVPNAWKFIRRDTGTTTAAPVEGAGLYTVKNQKDGPASISSLGREVWKVVWVDAVDQVALVAQGDATVAADRRVTAVLEISTGPLPIAGHFDVALYSDEALGAPVKLQARSWDLPLDGSDMTWTWEVVQ